MCIALTPTQAKTDGQCLVLRDFLTFYFSPEKAVIRHAQVSWRPGLLPLCQAASSKHGPCAAKAAAAA